MQSERQEDVHTSDIAKDVITFSILFPLMCKCLSQTYAEIFCNDISCADSEVGGPDPLKNRKIGFLSTTGPDPLKTTKPPSQHSMLGHHRHVRETPFKWCFTGVPMMARL